MCRFTLVYGKKGKLLIFCLSECAPQLEKNTDEAIEVILETKKVTYLKL